MVVKGSGDAVKVNSITSCCYLRFIDMSSCDI